MKRHLTAAAAIGLSAALISGSPTATARPVDTTEVSPNKIDALLLSAREVSRIYDVRVKDMGSSQKPDRPWPLDNRECGRLMTLTTDTFGSSFDGFRATTMMVPDDNDQPVVLILQAVAAYSDAGEADDTFEEAFPSSLRNCDRIMVHSRNDPPELSYLIQVVKLGRDRTQAVTHWVANDDPVGIACALNAQPASNALIGVLVCAPGDATKLTVDFMQRITNRVAGM